MKIIIFLIVISLLVALGFLFAFFWAVKNGQYEDSFTPSMRILIDDDMHAIENTNNTEYKSNTKQKAETTINNGRDTKI